MTPLRIVILAMLGPLALAACAAASRPPTGAAALPSPPGTEDCLWARNLDDWSPIDRERLILWGPGAGKHRTPYLATLTQPSYDLGYALAIGFDDRDRDDRICSFDSIIVRNGSSYPDRIMIRSLQRIEQAEAQKLLDAANPRRASKKHKVEAVAPAEGAAPSGAGGEAPPAGR